MAQHAETPVVTKDIPEPIVFVSMSTVIVLAKQPVVGRVKTRLCPPCTLQQAADLATAALADTFAAVSNCRADRLVAVFDGHPDGIVPASYEVVPQRSGTLDIRLADAFDDVLGEDIEPVVLIAMDTPQVTAEQLDRALDALADNDAVIGMTEDGGYWIIGLVQADRRVFEGVAMSEPTTGALQLERLRSLGLAVAELATLRDLDTAADVSWVAATYPSLSTSTAWLSFGQ